MLKLPWQTWERFFIWMALGLVVYFAYGYRHSKLRKR
jgi:APA family basic amino acid/polyamine antiporter